MPPRNMTRAILFARLQCQDANSEDGFVIGDAQLRPRNEQWRMTSAQHFWKREIQTLIGGGGAQQIAHLHKPDQSEPAILALIYRGRFAGGGKALREPRAIRSCAHRGKIFQ